MYNKWAQKNQIVDTPNERSSHTHQPIRGMGVVFPLVFVLFSFISWYKQADVISPLVSNTTIGFLFLGGGVLLAGITGFIDDRLDLRSVIRLPLYTLSACIGLFPLIQANVFQILWFIPLLIIIVGIINTYNFMDGINGITGFYTLVFFASCLALLHHEEIDFILNQQFQSVLIVSGAYLIAFGFFNYRKLALAFLGDAGSVSLGLLVCLILTWLGALYDRWDILILVVVYGVDSVGTIVLRIIRKENIFKAHRSHLYQDLVHIKGLGHIQVSVLYALMQATINAVYIYNFEVINDLFVVTIGVLSVTYIVSKKSIGSLQFRTNNE